MPDPHKAWTVYVGGEYTYLSEDGHAYSTPADALADGLGGLLDRISPLLRRPVGVLLLDAEICKPLGFTGTKPPGAGSRKKFPALDSAREHGWTINSVHRWLIARKVEDGADRIIHVGILPWLPRTVFPLRAPDPRDTMRRMRVFAELLGEPYHGDQAGLVGIAMMRDQIVTPKMKSQNRPFWSPDWTSCPPARAGNTELPDEWRAPDRPQMAYLHCYDLTTQHLAAAQAVKVSPGPLSFVGRSKVPDLSKDCPAGYYEITVPRMHAFERLIPHPVGQYAPGAQCWVTHATMNVLFEAADEHGMIDYPEVHRAYLTSHPTGGTRLLRDWAGTIVQAVKDAATLKGKPIDPDGAVLDAVKSVYKAGRGMLQVERSRVYRPDWAHAIVAQARANLWRKVVAQGRADDRWPYRVQADQVWYESNDADGESAAAWPSTFKRGDGATQGTFIHKGTEPQRAEVEG